MTISECYAPLHPVIFIVNCATFSFFFIPHFFVSFLFLFCLIYFVEFFQQTTKWLWWYIEMFFAQWIYVNAQPNSTENFVLSMNKFSVMECAMCACTALCLENDKEITMRLKNERARVWKSEHTIYIQYSFCVRMAKPMPMKVDVPQCDPWASKQAWFSNHVNSSRVRWCYWRCS